MGSINAAAPIGNNHVDGTMLGRPTAKPAAHLGGRTVAPRSRTAPAQTRATGSYHADV